MAYKALYRTYRPQSFQDVVGQSHVTKTLENAIKENRIAHAYLFCGPRGTGKTTIAKILAKAINCTGDHPPCNECENCRSITTSDHPDVIEIDAASNNGVDEVRDLIDKVKYAPIKGKYKVYIIDEVHMMSNSAFNALLKTLEEPPAHIVFIMATTEPHKILSTIISRCQRFDFKRVEENDIIQRLEYVLKEENKQYENDALVKIAKLADGGMRDALSILEQCLAYSDILTVDCINHVYGLLSSEKKISFIKLLLNKDMKGVLYAFDDMISKSIDLKRLTQDLIDVLKDIIIYKNTKELQLLFVLNQTDIDSIVPYILTEEAFEMIDIFMEASQQYHLTIDPSTYFELALLKICNHVKEEKVIQVKETVVEQPVQQERKEESVQQKVVEDDIEEVNTDIIEEEFFDKPVVENKQVNNIDIQINVDFNDILNILVQAKRTVLNEILDKWPVIQKYCYNLNTAKYATMLCEGTPVAAGEHAFILTFEHMPDVNNVNYSKNYYLLKDFLKEVLGQEYDFIAVLKEEWPKIRNKYIELHKNKSLPSPKPIVLHHIEKNNDENDTLNDAQKFALQLFGEDIVKFEK